MLETKLNELTETVITLTSAIENLAEQMRKLSASTVTTQASTTLEDAAEPGEKPKKRTRKTKKQIEAEKPVEQEVELDDLSGDEPVETPETTTISRDELQTLIMKLVRKDRSNKREIVKILNSYDANSLTELDDGYYGEVWAKVKGL